MTDNIDIEDAKDFEKAKHLQAQDLSKPIVKTINVYKVFGTDHIMAALVQAFPHLESLGLGGCHKITNASMPHISRLTKLREVYLFETQVTDAGLAYLSNLTELQTLYIANTKITDAGLEHLLRLTKLDPDEFYTGHTGITKEGLKNFWKRVKDSQHQGQGREDEKTQVVVQEEQKEESKPAVVVATADKAVVTQEEITKE